MATLGRWTGGTIGTKVPTTSWAAPNAVFPTQARNDGSTYGWSSSTSTITLPSTDLADGYLVRACIETEDTSNGRYNPSGRFIQASGTGNFLSTYTSGYSRDNSEDRAFLQVVAVLDNPSASATIQFQWKRDTDAPNTSDGTVNSAIEIIPLYYSDIGMYTSTTAEALGGTTPNTASIGTTVVGGTNITRSGNVVTVAGDNKRHLVIGNIYGEGWSSTSRTQRCVSLEYDGTEDNQVRSYFFSRLSTCDNGGAITWDILETATANKTIELVGWRGTGTSAFQGGADVDATTAPTQHKALIVIELNDSADCIRSYDSSAIVGTGNQELALTGPVDINCADTVSFNDSASFTKATATTINTEQAMDALVGANVFGAQGTVSTASRWTARSHLTVNGTEDNATRHGNYQRNNQGTTDTFGWAANPGGFLALSNGDDIGFSVQELSGTEGGGGDVETIGASIWAINLDTLEGTTPQTLSNDYIASSYSIYEPTVSPGAVTLTADFIASSYTVYEPTLTSTVTLSADFIAATSTTYEPTVSPGAATLTADFISSSYQVFEPNLIPGAITLTSDYIATSYQIYEPTLTSVTPLNVDFIASSNQTFEPTLTPGAVTLSADYIVTSYQIFEPTLSPGAVTLTSDFIASSYQTFEPTLTPGAVTLTSDYIVTSYQVFEPDVNLVVAGQILCDYIPSVNQIYEPTLTPGPVTLTSDYINTSYQVFEPTLLSTFELGPDFISSGNQVFEPVVTTPQPQTLDNNFISSSYQVFEPGVTTPRLEQDNATDDDKRYRAKQSVEAVKLAYIEFKKIKQAKIVAALEELNEQLRAA